MGPDLREFVQQFAELWADPVDEAVKIGGHNNVRPGQLQQKFGLTAWYIF